MDDFILHGGLPTDDPRNISEQRYRGLTLDDTRAWIEELTLQVREVREAIDSVLQPAEKEVPGPTILAERGIDLDRFPSDVVNGTIREINRSLRRVDSAFFGLERAIRLPLSDLQTQRQDARISEADRLQSEIQAVQAELDIQKRSLSELAAPEGVGKGVSALLGLSLLGIVFPSVLMAFRPVPDGPSIRIAVIVGFVLGLGGVLWFIIWQWRMLGQDKDPENTSDISGVRSLLGWIRRRSLSLRFWTSQKSNQ